MKNILFPILLLSVNYIFSQQDLYVEFDSELEDFEYIKQSDRHFNFKSSSQEFTDFLKAQKITHIQEAYPQTRSNRLKNIYKIRSQNPKALEDFIQRKEVIH